MELRHFRYFVTVADEMSFTRGAKRLNIAQPPLSKQIHDLEEELGVSLFVRNGRSIMLTHAGKEFLAEARQLLDNFVKVQQRALLRARGDLGHLRLGAVSSMARPTLAEGLREFQKLNPGIKLSLVQQSSFWQTQALMSGEIDVGFLRTSTNRPKPIEVQSICRQPMKLAVPSDHHLAKKDKVEWKDFSAEPLILIDMSVAGPEFYEGFFTSCRKAGFEPLIQQYAMNTAIQVWLVSAGVGIALITTIPYMAHLKGVLLLDLPKNAPVYETAIAWRRSDTSAALGKFLDFWRPRASQIVP